MILVGQLDSPYVRRVAVSMTLLGVPFERDRSSVFGDFDHVRAANPVGRVPALILDDGTVLVDSNAIVDWLDQEAGPDRALMPPAGTARRDAWRLVALALGCNDKLVATVYEVRLRPAEQRCDPWIERCRVQIDAALAALDEAAAAADPWLGGDRPSQADVTVGAMLGFLTIIAPFTGLEPPRADRFPHLARLSATCEAHPAFAACYPPDDERP